MLTISSIFILIVISFCHGQSTINRECTLDTVDFATKVEKSSVVVYGKSMSKIMNDGSDSIFHVLFQVDCILKGPATVRQINITNAGRVEGKQYCQKFPIGKGYSIAFLEPISLNETDHETFTPADFVEILDEGNSTSDLLARTCSLHRLVPRETSATVTEVCPSVGTDPMCHEIVSTTVIMKTDNIINNNDLLINTTPALITATDLINTTKIITSDAATNTFNKTLIIPGDKGRKTHPIHTPQQEIDAIRSKSHSTQVDVDKNNGGNSMTISILLMIMAIFFCSN